MSDCHLFSFINRLHIFLSTAPSYFTTFSLSNRTRFTATNFPASGRYIYRPALNVLAEAVSLSGRVRYHALNVHCFIHYSCIQVNRRDYSSVSKNNNCWYYQFLWHLFSGHVCEGLLTVAPKTIQFTHINRAPNQ